MPVDERRPLVHSRLILSYSITLPGSRNQFCRPQPRKSRNVWAGLSDLPYLLYVIMKGSGRARLSEPMPPIERSAMQLHISRAMDAPLLVIPPSGRCHSIKCRVIHMPREATGGADDGRMHEGSGHDGGKRRDISNFVTCELTQELYKFLGDNEAMVRRKREGKGTIFTGAGTTQGEKCMSTYGGLESRCEASRQKIIKYHLSRRVTLKIKQ